MREYKSASMVIGARYVIDGAKTKISPLHF